MVNFDYDLIVIGAGSAGLTAAIGAKQIGAKTLLVEKEKVGGDCTHYGCVPSKALIKIGRVARNLLEFEKYGVDTKTIVKEKVDMEKVLERVEETVYSVYRHETPEKLQEMGLDVEVGDAKFVDKKTIEVNGKRFSSKKFVIATGARARVPDVKGILDVDYLTNKSVFFPKKFKSICIVGGGPIGCELAQAFNNLEVEVTIVEHGERILSREDEEASLLMEHLLRKEGVRILTNQRVLEVRNEGRKKSVTVEDNSRGGQDDVVCDEVLFAVGRVPNVEGLDLEKAGVEFDEKGIKIDASTRTKNKNIFAIGDVAGGFQFTHFSNHQGKIALANLIFGFSKKYEKQVIPRVTFTSPEVASVGEIVLDTDPRVEKGELFVFRKQLTQVDRAITDAKEDGFFKIVCDKKGFIKGAVLVCENSGELISEIALAMKNKIKITSLADTIHPYPTYSYGLRNCCDQFRSKTYTESKKNLVKKIFGLRG